MTDRIKALASILKDEDHDDDDWGDNSYLSTVIACDRRSRIECNTLSSRDDSANVSNGYKTNSPAPRNNLKSAIHPWHEESNFTIEAGASSNILPAAIASSSIDGSHNSLRCNIQVNKDQCRLKQRKQCPIPPISLPQVKEKHQHSGSGLGASTTDTIAARNFLPGTAVATTVGSSMGIASEVPSSLPLSHSKMNMTQTNLTTQASEATSGPSASSSLMTHNSSHHIVFGRPDTFGAAGMGVATNEDTYYMPNVRERAKALSYWKLTKQDRNGHQRALEWKRNCCSDDDDEVANRGSSMNAQESIHVRYVIGDTSQENIDGAGHNAAAQVAIPYCNASVSDSSSLSAALTMKKASAPCFLAKFVQLLEEDESGQEIKKECDKENSSKSSSVVDSFSRPNFLMAQQEHENKINGIIPVIRNSSERSQCKSEMMPSPRAALSPRFDNYAEASHSTIAAVSQSPSAKLNKREDKLSKTSDRLQQQVKNIPRSPRILITRSPSFLSTTTIRSKSFINNNCDHGHSMAEGEVDWRTRTDKNVKLSDNGYETSNLISPRSEKVFWNGNGKSDDSSRSEAHLSAFVENGPRKEVIKTMTMAADSVMQDAMNFLKTPLFSFDCSHDNRDHDNLAIMQQQEQNIVHGGELHENELLEDAKRFALSLDRFLIRADNNVASHECELDTKGTCNHSLTPVLDSRRAIDDPIDTSSIGELLDESQTDENEWIGWVETPRQHDESNKKLTSFQRTSNDNNDCSNEGGGGTPTDPTYSFRKPPKIKICIDGAPEFTNPNNDSFYDETAFFVASQPSPSCGDDACLLVDSRSTIPSSSTLSAKKFNIKKLFLTKNTKSLIASKCNISTHLSNTSALLATTSSLRFGRLSGDDCESNLAR